MPKYGRGLNKEIYLAVKSGEIEEIFGIIEVRKYISKKGWNIPESYINVCLTNAAAENHSPTYKKYFNSVGNGKYKISLDYCE